MTGSVPEVPALGTLVAALDGDRADVASLTRVLTGALSDALPAGVVDVEYERSMSDRMHGRPGVAVGITVTLDETVLTMRQGRGGRPEPVIARAVRGVVLTRRPVSVTEWITALAEGVRALAERDADAREALVRLLLR